MSEEPLADWERELLSEPYRSRRDAAVLRNAADIFRARCRKQTFVVSVIIRVLELRADRLERTHRE